MNDGTGTTDKILNLAFRIHFFTLIIVSGYILIPPIFLSVGFFGSEYCLSENLVPEDLYF